MDKDPETIDTLIVGQGLAGTVLALQLLDRVPGERIRIVDTGSGNTSSRAALGILNPVTGMRFSPTWKWQTCWAEAETFYRRMEQQFRRRFFRPCPIYRLFRDQKEKNRWSRFREREGVLNWVDEEFETAPAVLTGHVHGELGGMALPGGWLDIDGFLDAARQFFRESGILIEEKFAYDDAEITADDVRWKHLQARRLVFCEGHAIRHNPWFGDFPMGLAKGQSLLIRMPEFPPDLIVIRKIFFLPMERDDEGAVIRIGSTWEWDDLTPRPTPEGREHLEGLIRKYSDKPFEVLDQSAGVRPISKDKKPIVGSLPGRPHVAVLNGLGSKGSLLAPHFAGELIDHLISGTKVDPLIDVCRM